VSGAGGSSPTHDDLARRADLVKRASLMERRELYYLRVVTSFWLIGVLCGMVLMALFDWYFYNTPLVGWLR